jgi:hypothetical protein
LRAAFTPGAAFTIFKVLISMFTIIKKSNIYELLQEMAPVIIISVCKPTPQRPTPYESGLIQFQSNRLGDRFYTFVPALLQRALHCVKKSKCEYISLFLFDLCQFRFLLRYGSQTTYELHGFF